MRKTFGNLVNVIGGEALLRIANFVSIIIVARLYGAGAVGDYAAILAITTIAVQLADNGLLATAVTEISPNLDATDEIVYRLYVAKFALMVPAVLILLAVAPRSLPSRTIGLVGALVIARSVLQQFAQMNLAVLKSIDQMKSIGPVQAVHFVFLICGFGAIFARSLPIYWLFTWLLAGQLLEFLLSARKLWGFGIRPKRSGLWQCLSLAKRSTPLGITYTVANFILRTDVIVASLFLSSAVVGRFAAAHMLLTFVYLVAWLSGSVWLPDLIRIGIDDPAGRRQFVNRWVMLILGVCIPFGVLLSFLAPTLVPMLYGPGFVETGRLLAIMALAVPFIMVNALLLNRAIALGQSSVFLGVYIGTAILAIVLDVTLLRTYGLRGLAAAIAMREVFMFLAFQILGKRELQSSTSNDTLFSRV